VQESHFLRDLYLVGNDMETMQLCCTVVGVIFYMVGSGFSYASFVRFCAVLLFGLITFTQTRRM